MNRKLIAAAVSAAVIAPVAAQAGDVNLYGNITNGIFFDDNDATASSWTSKDGANDAVGGYFDATTGAATLATTAPATESTSGTNMGTVYSRIGVKASSDLGNGMTASGRYEFATNTDDAADGITGTRIATVGLSGSFGSVTLGQQWSTYFNTIGTLVSPNYSVYVPHGSYSRTANTIQYTNSFGPIGLGIDVRVDDDEPYKDAEDDTSGVRVIDGGKRGSQADGGGGGTTLGVTIKPMDNLTVGLVFDTADGKEGEDGSVALDSTGSESVGIAAKMTFGNFWGSVGYQQQEFDQVDSDLFGSLVLTGQLGLGATEAYSASNLDRETDYTQIWLGTNLGENTTLAVGYGRSELDGSFDANIINTTTANPPVITTTTSGFKGETETEHFTVAFNHKLGGGFHLFAEYMDISTESNVSGKIGSVAYDVDLGDAESQRIVTGMRLNF